MRYIEFLKYSNKDDKPRFKIFLDRAIKGDVFKVELNKNILLVDNGKVIKDKLENYSSLNKENNNAYIDEKLVKYLSSLDINTLDKLLKGVTDYYISNPINSEKQTYEFNRFKNTVDMPELIVNINGYDIIIGMNKIVKDSEFGGGNNFKMFEILTAVAIQILFNSTQKELDMKQISEKVFETALSDVGMLPGEKHNVIYGSFKHNTEWNNTFLTTAREINKTFSGGAGYKVVYSSNTIKAIKKKFIKVKNTNIKMNFNKFIPADIWLMEENAEELIIKEIKSQETLEGLRIVLNDLYTSKKFVGLSLKKTSKDGKLIEVNTGDALSVPKFDRIHFNWKTINILIDGDSNKHRVNSLQYRAFQTITGWQGELGGKDEKAKHGKIGETATLNIIKEVAGCTVDLTPSKEPEVLFDLIIQNLDMCDDAKEFKDKFFGKDLKPVEKFKDFINDSRKKNSILYSKTKSLKLISFLKTLKKHEMNSIYEKLYLYASSQIPGVSCSFMKIY